MHKLVLLIAPQYMNIYKDVIEELENQGYIVDFISAETFNDDPNNVRGNIRYGSIFVKQKQFYSQNKERWKKKLASFPYNKKYDILFVLDAQSLDGFIFEELKRRNPNLFSINYLFDTVKGVYKFNVFFKYFDKIITFDPVEAKQFHIEYFPIYWKNSEYDVTYSYDIFGMGAISQVRYELFEDIKRQCEKMGLTYFLKLFSLIRIKLWVLYDLRCFLRKILGIGKYSISKDALKSDFLTTNFISPTEFRKYIANSQIVIDTSAAHQDGMTARFMWALGLGKKIITSNQKVLGLDLYDANQIYVYTNSTDQSQLASFIKKKYTLDAKRKEVINKYRIDNWIVHILNEK